MKKIFLVAGILLVTTTVTFARNNSGRNDAKEVKMGKNDTRKEIRKERGMEDQDDVSERTKAQFAIDFPDATNVHFVRTDNFDEVVFVQNKKKIRAYYDYDNNLVGITQKESFTDLPGNAQKEILEKYPGYTITHVIKGHDYEDNDMDMIYEGPFDNTDDYFVELKNDSKEIVVKVDLSGDVSYFTTMR